MRIVSLEEAYTLPPGDLKQSAYCALDCTGTLEIFNLLHPRLDEQTARTYAFERALQAPALAMQMRGVRVNVPARQEAVRELKKELSRDVRALDKHSLVQEVWDGVEKDTGKCKKATRKDGKHKWEPGKPDVERVCLDCGAPRLKRSPFNANSPAQADRLFYTLLQAPEQRNKQKKRSTDEDCLRRIGQKRPDLAPLTSTILDIRDKEKQLGFLECKIWDNQRFPSSFNVGAAWTGRFSSSKSPLGGGGNAQNIAARHRHIFIADPGYELCYVDLERAESWVVAMLSGDQGYIEAHEGDTHTYVARLLWPELPWTGDIVKDAKVAKSRRPPWDDVEGHDYRFQAKRIQHGSNYGLTPPGISMIAKIPMKEASKAQMNYFQAFPHIPAWQAATGSRVKQSLPLTNPLGRRIRLFGRPWDGHTYKQGLAFVPQSTVADVLNIGLWRTWHNHDPHTLQVLAQVHDAILLQWPQHKAAAAVAALKESLNVPLHVTDYQGTTRTLTIPIEIAVGRNWGYYSADNPWGIEDIRKREKRLAEKAAAA